MAALYGRTSKLSDPLDDRSDRCLRATRLYQEASEGSCLHCICPSLKEPKCLGSLVSCKRGLDAYSSSLRRAAPPPVHWQPSFPLVHGFVRPFLQHPVEPLQVRSFAPGGTPATPSQHKSP
ncbi:hypothetical protein PAXRUDRAFT_379252 [Paxillus rubicundulus Ve08.2h10]|uniref:Uncharacterized protein n=1 Tax=Paxillus rubicundulus Ve08.2h10 TaxID=930991 RepID=A0A0D0D1J5_9AGAM|nr:hypothetical protein PAXRUDRAFT_379252 [Paxillus rubicundulus Ve08.2h10]